MEKRLNFQGTGGALFVKFLVGMLLTGITFGIYGSWFMCNLLKYIFENAPTGKLIGIYNTEYRTVSNLTQQRYYFELTTSPNVIWADLNKFDLAPGSPVRSLNPDNIDLSGDVSDKFQKLERSPF